MGNCNKFEFVRESVTVTHHSRFCSGMKLAVRWVDPDNGNRFHFWASHSSDSGKLCITDHIYKNPPNGVRMRSEGWFDTRYLNPTSKVWRKFTQDLLQWIEAEGLIDAAYKEEKDCIRAELNRDADAAEVRIKAEHGEELFNRLASTLRVAQRNRHLTSLEEESLAFVERVEAEVAAARSKILASEDF